MEPENTDSTKHLDTIGALAAIFSGLAARLDNNFKMLGYILFAVNGILLVAIAVVRLNNSLQRRRDLLFPIAGAMSLIALVLIGLAGWSIAHPPSPAVVTPSPPVVQQVVPAVTNTYSTSGKNSPIINGPTAPITIGDAPAPPARKDKHK